MLTFLRNVQKIAPTNPSVPESQFMWTYEIINWSFPSCPNPLFQSEVKCEAIDMKIGCYSHANKLLIFPTKVLH